MALNPSKSVAILFGTPQRLKSVSDLKCITVADTAIPLSDKVKFLGVTLDSNLTMGLHTIGAIEHGGGTCPPPKFLTAGVRGHNKIYGAPVKKIKKISEKAKYSAKEVFSVSSLGNGHTATDQQLCRSHCVKFMSAQTAVRHRKFSSSTSCIAVW